MPRTSWTFFAQLEDDPVLWGFSKVHSNYEYCLFYQNLLLNSVTHTVWRLGQTSHAHLIFFFCTNKPICICKILKVPRCNFCLRELMNRNCGFYVLDPITQLMHLKGLSFFLQLTPWIACWGCVTHECALIWINFDFGAKVQWKFKIGKKSTAKKYVLHSTQWSGSKNFSIVSKSTKSVYN